jgi:hypothetical protein
LAAVNSAAQSSGSAKVTLVGRGPGGTNALLDARSLRLQLLSTLAMHTVRYGMPRVGNPAFADYINGNANVGLTRINNMNDPAWIRQGRFLGFHHASAKVHIDDVGGWYACPDGIIPTTNVVLAACETSFKAIWAVIQDRTTI